MSKSTVLTSNELFINMKPSDIPTYNPRKHYFEQSKDVLDFWDEEFKKITYGVNIGGYFFHPWAYFHLNFFRTPIPTKVPGKTKTEDKSKVPPLDDLFLNIVENYQEAEESDKGLFLFGTRGSTKSTLLASNSAWTVLTSPNGVHSIMGGSDPDLKNISRLIRHCFENITPAFRMPTIRADWESEVIFGIKQSAKDNITHSIVSITNTKKGNKRDSEKGAGLSPVGYIFDEVGKSDFWSVYESALPSFRTQYGFKLVPILAGTGGNEELSLDAQKVMEDPESHDMLLCNWDRLERGVPEEFITWKESKKKPFGTFMPGQMSYRLDVEKVKKPLSEYLGISSKELKKIPIYVTDWEKATNRVKELTSSAVKDEKDRLRNRMYYPLETDDCFLTDSENPFPTKIIEQHVKNLKAQGNTGKDIELYKQDGKQKFNFSSKKRSKIRHTGGESDAPIVAHIDPPEEPFPEYTCVAGLDGYKIDVSETTSLGSMYILTRRNLEPNSPCETIAASYSARPSKMRYFNQTCEKMLRAWGAKCLIESVDMGFQQFLENKDMAQDLLAKSFTLSGSKGANSKLKSSYGIYPTTGNKEYMFNLLIDWCKEEHVLGIDEDGNQIIKTGVEFITDIELLREMLSYKKGGNFDRIDAFMHALTYARELDKKGYFPKDSSFRQIQTVDKKKSQSYQEKVRSAKYTSAAIRSRLKRY